MRRLLTTFRKVKKKNSSELKLANELLTQFSSEDIAVALIESFKGKLPPIEEVESFSEEKVNLMKSDRKKKKRGEKRNRGSSSKKKQRS